jgi:hypothetical protein
MYKSRESMDFGTEALHSFHLPLPTPVPPCVLFCAHTQHGRAASELRRLIQIRTQTLTQATMVFPREERESLSLLFNSALVVRAGLVVSIYTLAPRSACTYVGLTRSLSYTLTHSRASVWLGIMILLALRTSSAAAALTLFLQILPEVCPPLCLSLICLKGHELRLLSSTRIGVHYTHLRSAPYSVQYPLYITLKTLQGFHSP